MSKSGDPISYYVASAPPSSPFPQLNQRLNTDICIVGGGISGCSTALRLAEKGFAVALIEQAEIGSGASGRNGGQALPGVACGQLKLEQLVGPSDARRIWEMTLEGVSDMRALIDADRIGCEWTSGHLMTAIKPRHKRELEVELELLQTRYGYTGVRLVDESELRALLPTRRYIGALHDRGSGHLNPLLYVRGLAAAAVKRGAQIFERSAMTAYTDAGQVEVQTARGRIACRHLILCGNAALAAAMPALGRKILGVGTSIVATEVLGEKRARELITNNAAVADMNWVLDYFRRTPDHRLLFGGRVKYSATAAAHPELTRRRLLRVYPQLADAHIDYAWSGTIDITLNRAPHFGRLQPNIYFLQGFSGHGIVLAGIAGRLIAEAVAGTAERFDVFARIAHRDFPGGDFLRRPALALAMLYFRLRDAM